MHCLPSCHAKLPKFIERPVTRRKQAHAKKSSPPPPPPSRTGNVVAPATTFAPDERLPAHDRLEWLLGEHRFTDVQKWLRARYFRNFSDFRFDTRVGNTRCRSESIAEHDLQQFDISLRQTTVARFWIEGCSFDSVTPSPSSPLLLTTPTDSRIIPPSGARAARRGRIGKAVQFRYVPNAVRTMPRQQATGSHREGVDSK